ncbi:MAG: hypothetical protein GY860_16870 [Desulfobacteraceae bacterium]|nr:hypothetical protein [Desulfobacteraceae bacterium]
MTNFWKNKKILAYIALSHHTRFITPVMERLESRGATIKYIVGQAERSQEITAIELGLKYSHIFDYVRDKDHKQILQNYNTLRKTFAGSLKNDFFLGLLPVTVTDKTLFSTATEYVGFKNLLQKEKPDLCFALHELNRWGKMFAFWAKKENRPFISLQEGLTYNLDFAYSGHAQYSTLNLVWGERVKKKMVSFEAPESKILPVGNTHLAKEIAFQKTNKIRETKRQEQGISDHFVILLILSSILPKPELFTPIFKTVSESTGQTIFVKFHPACRKPQLTKWVESITAQFKDNIRFIHTQEDTYNLISMSDVCVLGQPSTTGLESIALGTPLVKLDFAYTPNAPYSFVDQGVAVKMSAEQLSDALSKKTDFSQFMDKEKKRKFLKNELIEPTQAIKSVCHIFKKTIQANTSTNISLEKPRQKPDKQWSIIIQVPDKHDIFLSQLEAVSFNSEDAGDYEIILLEPEKNSKEIIRVLDSLTGDLKRIPIPENKSSISMINQAALLARGKNLLFLEKNLAPLKGWLDCLNNAFLKYGKNKLFGAQICDNNGRIANAGMVVDHNNTPVSAYQHLNTDFSGVLKERSFQMVDHFVAMEKNLFFKTGGFTPDAGKYLFLDICLKARQSTNDPDTIVYLPKLKMIFLDQIDPKKAQDSIYFYGKWNGCLWESENELHQKDGISSKDLAQAKISSAMQSVR